MTPFRLETRALLTAIGCVFTLLYVLYLLRSGDYSSNLIRTVFRGIYLPRTHSTVHTLGLELSSFRNHTENRLFCPDGTHKTIGHLLGYLAYTV